MSIIQINDISDTRLDAYLRLTEGQLRNRQNKEKGIFIAESKTVIELALENGIEPVSFLIEKSKIEGAEKLSEKYPDIPVFVMEDSLLSQITGYSLSRGYLSAMKRPTALPFEEIIRNAKRICVLEDIADSTNVGAIMRSAAALGIDALLLNRGSADPLLRRAARVSMGTVFQIPWAYIDDILSLKKYGFKLVSMALCDNTVDISDKALKSEPRLAIMLGTEGTGLKKETIAASDYTVKIPMYHNVDSLNVAAASAVAFWELCKK